MPFLPNQSDKMPDASRMAEIISDSRTALLISNGLPICGKGVAAAERADQSRVDTA